VGTVPGNMFAKFGVRALGISVMLSAGLIVRSAAHKHSQTEKPQRSGHAYMQWRRQESEVGGGQS